MRKAMFEFSEGAALVNPLVGNAFQMGYQKRETIASQVMVDTGKYRDRKGGIPSIEALKTVLHCNVCNAILFVAPYVKIVAEVVLSSRGGLRRDLRDATFTVTIDGERIVQDGLVTDCLIDPDGNIPGTAWPDLSRSMVLFTGFPYPIEKGKLGKMFAAPTGLPLGLFMPNATEVRIDLQHLPGRHGEIQLEAGIVAAMYTTKPEEIGAEGRKTRLEERVLVKKS